MKALVGAFNQEKALVGAFSVIVQPVVELMDRFTALLRNLHSTVTDSVLMCVNQNVVELDLGGCGRITDQGGT